MDRFQKIYSQGVVNTIEVWVDRETDVNYVWRKDGYAGGLTSLLDENGKPVVTKI